MNATAVRGTTPFGLMAASIALLLAALSASAPAQLNVAGQASAHLLKAQRSGSQYSVDDGRATFGWRLDLFADAEISDRIFFLSNFRVMQDQDIHIDLFALRFTGLAGQALNAEIGQIDPPFGALGERRFPKSNPFFSLPLGREHLTTLCRSDYKLWLFDSRHSSAGDGVRLIEGSLYDLGVKAFGRFGIVEYAVALTNGAPSSGGSYSPGGLNSNRGFGKYARVALSPVTGLTAGVSYSRGPFLPSGADPSYGGSYAGGYDPAEYFQELVGADLEYSIGHVEFTAEGFHNRWAFANEYGSDLTATGFSGEVRFVPATRLSLAARVGGIFFNRINGIVYGPQYLPVSYDGPWDRDIVRIEGAAGYRITREALVKIIYQHNRMKGTDPTDDQGVVQLVVSF